MGRVRREVLELLCSVEFTRGRMLSLHQLCGKFKACSHACVRIQTCILAPIAPSTAGSWAQTQRYRTRHHRVSGRHNVMPPRVGFPIVRLDDRLKLDLDTVLLTSNVNNA